jgi:hypothetical protein
LDEVKDLVVAIDEQGEQYEVDWDILIRRAKRFMRGNRLAPEHDGREITGLDEGPVEE